MPKPSNRTVPRLVLTVEIIGSRPEQPPRQAGAPRVRGALRPPGFTVRPPVRARPAPDLGAGGEAGGHGRQRQALQIAAGDAHIPARGRDAKGGGLFPWWRGCLHRPGRHGIAVIGNAYDPPRHQGARGLVAGFGMQGPPQRAREKGHDAVLISTAGKFPGPFAVNYVACCTPAHKPAHQQGGGPEAIIQVLS